MLKLKTESPFCDNFEDLGAAKNCPDGEKCYFGKCKYYELNIKNRVHMVSAFWLLIWFSFLQVTKEERNQTRVIRDCMGSTFFKQMNPDAPDSGCVDIKYKEGGEVSKNDFIFF